MFLAPCNTHVFMILQAYDRTEKYEFYSTIIILYYMLLERLKCYDPLHTEQLPFAQDTLTEPYLIGVIATTHSTTLHIQADSHIFPFFKKKQNEKQ